MKKLVLLVLSLSLLLSLCACGGKERELPSPMAFFSDVAEVTVTSDGAVRKYDIRSQQDLRDSVISYCQELRETGFLGDHFYPSFEIGLIFWGDEYFRFSFVEEDEEIERGEIVVGIKKPWVDENDFSRAEIWLMRCDRLPVAGEEASAPESGETQEENSQLPEEDEQPEKESQQTKNDPSAIPDFLDWGSGGDYEERDYSEPHFAQYWAGNRNVDAVYEYIRALESLGYTVIYALEEPHETGDGERRVWELVCEGLSAEAIGDHGGQITVTSNCYGHWDDQTLAIEYAEGITMGGDSGSGGDSGDDFYDRKCGTCNGTGKCWSCRGSGKKSTLHTGEGFVAQDCPHCQNGKCPSCGGNG